MFNMYIVQVALPGILDSLGSRSTLVPAFKSRLVHVAGISRALSLRHNDLLVFSKYMSVERGMGCTATGLQVAELTGTSQLPFLPFSFFSFSLFVPFSASI
jgi:hypothetical protein